MDMCAMDYGSLKTGRDTAPVLNKLFFVAFGGSFEAGAVLGDPSRYI